MTPLELRASTSLVVLVALRMLGLFLILPVFAVHARSLPGGDNTMLVGLALGIYGLTQGLLQIPFGAASDRYGRKPVIIAGLVLFALGSFVAAAATDVMTTIIGRSLQGAGAISAAVTAMIADSTRDSQRTKAMAMVGASIGLTFAISLVAAPLLYAAIGMGGLFAATGTLALAAIALVIWVVPAAPARQHEPEVAEFRTVLLDPDLIRLNIGIFVLHTVQMAMFVVVPTWLVERAGLALPEHWKLYLPVVLVSFAVMMPPLNWGEKHDRVRGVFLVSVALVALVQIGLALQPSDLRLMAALLLMFFVGFNVLEALLPSLVSRLAPPGARGAALGVYNTTQALGLFVGGALGGWLAAGWGAQVVFWVCAAITVLWWLAARSQQRWPSSAAPAQPQPGVA